MMFISNVTSHQFSEINSHIRKYGGGQLSHCITSNYLWSTYGNFVFISSNILISFDLVISFHVLYTESAVPCCFVFGLFCFVSGFRECLWMLSFLCKIALCFLRELSFQLPPRGWGSDRYNSFKRGDHTENFFNFKGELQRENKLISYEIAFKMLENVMYIAGISQALLELLSFKVESGNHQRGIYLLQKFSDIFGNMKLV